MPAANSREGLTVLDSLLAALEERHRKALLWFFERMGETVPWRLLNSKEFMLASTPKGIYKPKWTKYALSVRRTLGSPYPDRDVAVRPDGTWAWDYFQENTDAARRDSEYTNVGVLACLRDRIPVGALRQLPGRASAEYEVLGLALVQTWTQGYFHLEGFSRSGLAHPPALLDELEAVQESSGPDADALVPSPSSAEDARRRVLRAIVARQGQPKFRRELLRQFEGRCAITACNCGQALEAAHIRPYNGPHTNSPCNGVLLRADLHTLFDLGLLAIAPSTGEVRLSERLASTNYAGLAGSSVRLPPGPDSAQRAQLLEEHRQAAEL